MKDADKDATAAALSRAVSHLASVLPSTLISLGLPFSFNLPLASLNLPQSMTELKMRGDFNQPLDGLPPRLQHLTIQQRIHASAVTHPIQSHQLPPTLLEFRLSSFVFNHPVDDLILPLNLHTLALIGRGIPNQPLPHIMSHPLRLPSKLRSLELRLNGQCQ